MKCPFCEFHSGKLPGDATPDEVLRTHLKSEHKWKHRFGPLACVAVQDSYNGEASPFCGSSFVSCVITGLIIILLQLFVFIVGPIWLVVYAAIECFGRQWPWVVIGSVGVVIIGVKVGLFLTREKPTPGGER